MKVEKSSSTFMPFKDHFKKNNFNNSEDKKEKAKPKVKKLDIHNKSKDDNVIGWG